MHVIKSEWLPKDFGRQLTRAHELRLIADYKGDPIEKPDALAIVEQAKSFVTAVQTRMSPKPDPADSDAALRYAADIPALHNALTSHLLH